MLFYGDHTTLGLCCGSMPYFRDLLNLGTVKSICTFKNRCIYRHLDCVRVLCRFWCLGRRRRLSWGGSVGGRNGRVGRWNGGISRWNGSIGGLWRLGRRRRISGLRRAGRRRRCSRAAFTATSNEGENDQNQRLLPVYPAPAKGKRIRGYLSRRNILPWRGWEGQVEVDPNDPQLARLSRNQ